MDFEALLHRITETQRHLQQQAVASVNRMLTLRNWLIGFYIVEFEQHGQDRAEYGKKLLTQLAVNLSKKGLKGFSTRNLKLFRQFYRAYPQIGQTLSAQLQQTNFPAPLADLQSLTSSEKHELPSVYSQYSPPPDVLLRHFSFSHFVELIKIDDPLKRVFYEIEAIKGNWSVRQLQRQIGSLLYERTGLSTEKAALLEKIHQQQETFRIEDTIRDPYILEFTVAIEQKIFDRFYSPAFFNVSCMIFWLNLNRSL